MTAGGVFVSHAAADADLSAEFVKMLIIGGIPREHIFYTSQRSTGVPTGVNFREHIKQQLLDARLVIQLITPTYLQRPFCMAEAGAQWVLDIRSFPIVFPPLKREEVSGVLGGTQLAHLDEESLDDLYDTLTDVLGRRLPVRDWRLASRDFLDSARARLTAGPVVEPQADVTATDTTERRRGSAVATCGPQNDGWVNEVLADNCDLLVRAVARFQIPPGAESPKVRAKIRDDFVGILKSGSIIEFLERFYLSRGGVKSGSGWVAHAGDVTSNRLVYSARVWHGLRPTLRAVARAALFLPDILMNDVRVQVEVALTADEPSGVPLPVAGKALVLAMQTVAYDLPGYVILPLLQEVLATSVEVHLTAVPRSDSHGGHVPRSLTDVVDLSVLGPTSGRSPVGAQWARWWDSESAGLGATGLIAAALRDIVLDLGYLDGESLVDNLLEGDGSA